MVAPTRNSLKSFTALILSAIPAASEPTTVTWPELAAGRPAECVLFLEEYFGVPDCGAQGAMGRNVVSQLPDCVQGNRSLDGREVTIAGYIHPFELKFRGVTRFVLAPRVRQDCRHPPPPLPDQVVYVEFPEGVDVNADPVWAEGTLRVKTVQNHLAPSSYVLEATKISPAVNPDVPEAR